MKSSGTRGAALFIGAIATGAIVSGHLSTVSAAGSIPVQPAGPADCAGMELRPKTRGPLITLHGEFVVVEERIPMPYPSDDLVTWTRAVLVQDPPAGATNLMFLSAPGRSEDDVIIERHYDPFLTSITAYVMDVGFDLPVVAGWLTGEWREDDVYLPEAGKTVAIAHTEENIVMSGYIADWSWTGFPGITVFDLMPSECSFEKDSVQRPQVTTHAATQVACASARLNGAIEDTGSGSCDFRGFV